MSANSGRVAAGVSLLFTEAARPDGAALRAALSSSQTRAGIVQEDATTGTCEIVSEGLTFAIDGLAPALIIEERVPAEHHGFSGEPDTAATCAVRLYPGHHLSGGTSLAPVVRALLALAAELAVALPVGAVVWHPAQIAIAPDAFSRIVLAWLAGGRFPAQGLAVLSELADGSVVTRGLAHFVGSELIFRRTDEVEIADRQSIVVELVDWIVRNGVPAEFREVTIMGRPVRVEPAPQAAQILAWPA